MANHRSAEKAHRQSLTRNTRNTARRSKIRNAIKDVRIAVSSGDLTASQAKFRVAQKELFKGVTKSVLKRNSASRLVSRLNAAVKKVALAGKSK